MTAGPCRGCPRGEPLLAELKSVASATCLLTPRTTWMKCATAVRRLGAKACIRPNPTRKLVKRYSLSRCKNRNVIERFFGGLKRYRRVANEVREASRQPSAGVVGSPPQINQGFWKCPCYLMRARSRSWGPWVGNDQGHPVLMYFFVGCSRKARSLQKWSDPLRFTLAGESAC